MGANKVYSLLGICAKAGKLVTGEQGVLMAIQSGKARIVLVSTDASDNTRKQFHDKCKYYGVPILEYGYKEELGRAIGKSERTSLAVTDDGLSKALRKTLELQGGGKINGENKNL